MKYIKTYESKDFELKYNLKMLKSYVYILNKSKKDYSFAIAYFNILYNLLIIEHIFSSEVKSYKLNMWLEDKLKIEYNDEEIYEIFEELYDVNSVIRNNVENFNRNSEFIRNLLATTPSLWKKRLTKQEIEILKMKNDVDKYNL